VSRLLNGTAGSGENLAQIAFFGMDFGQGRRGVHTSRFTRLLREEIYLGIRAIFLKNKKKGCLSFISSILSYRDEGGVVGSPNPYPTK
jgi:hypothetical protein